MSNKIEQLEDYNTSLSNDDRAEISDYIESILVCLEGCRNMMVGMKFDININPDIKEALQSKINDIEEVLDKY